MSLILYYNLRIEGIAYTNNYLTQNKLILIT